MSQPVEINIGNLFTEQKYIVPLYQRNYAWEEAQVTQLIDDVWDYCDAPQDMPYYIGTLVVHKRKDDYGVSYAVIDGQQRLTTLNILLSILKNEFDVKIDFGYENNLNFDSRPISTQSLKLLADNKKGHDDIDPKMNLAYLNMKKKLSKYFESGSMKKFVNYLLSRVKLLRVEVPHDTDLNHYFEIMNNRGEQLEKHEILKAELLQYLKDDADASLAFTKIWDACSDMDRYLQYGFTPDLRKNLFSNSYNELPQDFDEIVSSVALQVSSKFTAQPEIMSFATLMQTSSISTVPEADNINETDTTFNTIVNFPNFLLHVLRVYTENDIPLDDKRLIPTFKAHIETLGSDKNKKIFVKKFSYSLLKCKFLLDRYIIKREYSNGYDGWSLQKIKIGESNKPYYTKTFDGEQPLMLLAMFHVSFPQMMYKHWLNGVLHHLFNSYQDGIDEELYVEYLEKLSDAFYFDRFGKQEVDYYDIIYTNRGIAKGDSIVEERLNEGTNVQNFIFNRLDYLLWKEIVVNKDSFYNIRKIETFEFSFRSSVEHFYPQHPKQGAKLEVVRQELLDNFGNLCLISRSKNSELSNYSPIAKAEHYNDSTALESLKQQIMIQLNEKWDSDAILAHQADMVQLLNQRQI